MQKIRFPWILWCLFSDAGFMGWVIFSQYLAHSYAWNINFVKAGETEWIFFFFFIPRIIVNIKIFVSGKRRNALWGPGYQKDSDSRREAHLTLQTSRGLYTMFIFKRKTLGMVFKALKWVWNVLLALLEFLLVFIYLLTLFKCRRSWCVWS